MSNPRQQGRLRRFRPTMDSLEKREVPASAVVTLVATPPLLSPPKNQFVKVIVHGAVYETDAKVTPSAAFQVSDEYRLFEPGGRVTLHRLTPNSYSFQFSITLQAHRSSQDYAGRQYFVVVGAQDYQGAQGVTIPILVPFKAFTPSQILKASTNTHVRITKGK